MGFLDGIRVIDASRILAGPMCGQTLADHGAEVIKLEPPGGDETRTWGPPFNDEGVSSYFMGLNRNKRGVALDLSRPEGREILLRLLENTDVLLENFKTGTLEKWGIGYEDVLKDRFPQLVHCRITGFGADGPLGGHAGYDAAVQASAGLMSINGDPSTGPMKLGTPVVDIGASMNAVIGILGALLERTRSGKGQSVEAALYDAGIAMLHPQAANYFMSGKTPAALGNAHPNISPYDKFPTATCDIFLAIGNNGQFAKFCRAIERPDLIDDERFTDNGKRSVNRDVLRAELITAIADKDGHSFCDELLAMGVPVGPVNTIPEVMAHPHTVHRQMKVDLGGNNVTGIPIKLSRTPGAIQSGPPEFGADTRQVLADTGYSEDEIEALLSAGIVVGNG